MLMLFMCCLNAFKVYYVYCTSLTPLTVPLSLPMVPQEMARMHSAYSSSLRQLQEGGADATSYPPAIPPACEAGDCDTGSLDVGAALDQSLTGLLTFGTGTGTVGGAGAGGQRGKGAGEAGSLVVATGGRSKGMPALGSGGLAGCRENGRAWAAPGVLQVRLHSGRDAAASGGAGADAEAAEAARGLTRQCGAFSMQLTAAAAMAASLRRAAEGQAHTWQRLRASLPDAAAAGGASAAGGRRGGRGGAGAGRLAAAGSGAEGALGAGEKVSPCEQSLGSRAQDEVS